MKNLNYKLKVTLFCLLLPAYCHLLTAPKANAQASLVADINPGVNPSFTLIGEFKEFNGKLYFQADNGINGNELVCYDGVTTFLAADINVGSGSSTIEYLNVYNGKLYFSADDGIHGAELWSYDGTTASLVADIFPGASFSSPSYLEVFSGKLYFSAKSSNAIGTELYSYDGTSVSLAAEISPGSSQGKPEFLKVFNGKLYFGAYDGIHGDELWSYDGTTASLAADIYSGNASSYPYTLTVYNNKLYFGVYEGIYGFEVWSFDGTNASLAADIYPGLGMSIWKPNGLMVYNGKLYFRQNDGTHGEELWSYDGTNAILAADMMPGPGSSEPYYLTEFNGLLYFSAFKIGIGRELWRYDGFAASFAEDIFIPTIPSLGNSSSPSSLITYNNKLFFKAYDEIHGYELWQYTEPPATLRFDGNNDYVATAPYTGNDFTGDLTVEAWFNGSDLHNRTLVSRRYFNEFDLSFNSNHLLYYHGNGTNATYASFAYTFSQNTWYHVAVVRNISASTVSLYVNGIFQQTVSWLANGAVTPVAQNIPLFIGYRQEFASNFQGKIDEVRIWNRTLCDAEITNNMNCELDPVGQTGLVALYHFNQGIPGATNAGITSLTDASSAAHNATLNNFALNGTTSNWATPGGVITGTACTPTYFIPEITVEGNSTAITDGDATPSATDYTDFGNVNTGSPFVRTYTIHNTGPTPLIISSITSSGTHAGMFVVSGVPLFIYSGTSATFDVTFTPASLGLKTATITINNNDCDEQVFNFNIQGTGVCLMSTPASNATSDAVFNEICNTGSTNLTVNGGSLGAGATWQWYTGSCAGTTAGTGTTINVSPTTNTTYFVRAEGTCGNTICVQVTITVKTLPPSSAVVVPPINNLPAYGCNGTVVLNINVPVVPTASQYIWDGPTGTTFNGGANPYISSTPTADVTFGSVSGGASGYSIGVQAANACGTTLRKVQWVRGIVSTPAAVIPAVSGLTTYCAGTSAGFSCETVVGATGYLWTITGDASFVASSNTVTVTFGPTWTTGTLCVAAQTPCYTTAPKCLALGSSTALAYAPVGIFTACPGSAQSYSVPPSINVASYSWTLPANTSGSSVTENINLSFLTGFVGGDICVTGTSVCGVVMTQKCKTISTTIPTVPASITGITSGLCGQTVTYNCPPQAGATFNWTLPSGAGGASTSNSILITFPNSGFTTAGLSVTASNACGTSLPRSITVKGSPNTPGVIIPNQTVCNGLSGIVFNASTMGLTGVYSLNWVIIPATAANIILGQGTNALTADWNTGNASINLTASNDCGSTTRTHSVVSVSCARVSSGTVVIEKNANHVYPNPATSQISFDGIESKANVTLTDILGKIVLQQKITAGEKLDIANLPRGMYFIKLISEDGTISSQKLILQ